MTLAPDPDPFQDTFVAMIAVRAIVTATTLGVWDALADGPADAATIAAQLGLDPVGVDLLMSALASTGYVDRDDGGRFTASAPAGRLLARSSTESIATFVGAFNEYNWDALRWLDTALQGGPTANWHEMEPDAPLWEPYIRGLFELSREEHDANAALVPVTEPASLLDIAGGHGAFAMAMCRRHPGLRATVLDLPGSARVGREIVSEEGYAERIEVAEGDLFKATLAAAHDVVSAFNLAHHLEPALVRELFARMRGALRPGGVAVVGDTERPAARGAEPPSQVGVMTALLFYATSGARTYTSEELRGWLEQAGFREVRVHRNERSPWRIVLIARG
jgi:SAM-dependent methyltransferase